MKSKKKFMIMLIVITIFVIPTLTPFGDEENPRPTNIDITQ